MNSDTSALASFGWNPSLARQFGDRFGSEMVPGRVTRVNRGAYVVQTALAEASARVTGAFEYQLSSAAEYPAVGDWVAVTSVVDLASPFRISGVMPRTSVISRKAPGAITQEQILAANVDFAFIVFSLERGRKSNPRAAERYLTTVWESGVTPVVILNKVDLAEELDQIRARIEAVAPGVEVVPISCVTGIGIARIDYYLRPGRTAVLLGPSGTGKSTLVNVLVGRELLRTRAVRLGDMKGRHTTTERQLVTVPTGGVIIDTPGLRELQLWGDGETINDSFPDISELANECRFRDCTHTAEPGCAVQRALSEGILDYDRYENYLDLTKELKYLRRRADERARREERDRWKQLNKQMRGFTKERRAGG